MGSGILSASLTLFGHPFSSYTQKALIALYEKELPFTFRAFGPDDPQAYEEFRALWPIGRFPLLVDAGRTVCESSIIIEHLELHRPGAVRLLPADPDEALEVRFLDRFFDSYVMSAMQSPVTEALRKSHARLELARSEAAEALEKAYGWLDERLADGRQWASGGEFTLADCAAAPSLFYADWVHPIGPERSRVREFRARLLRRASVTRAIEEARPYRHLFPLGAPQRD